MTSGTDGKPEALPPTQGKPQGDAAAKRKHQEELLDEALEQTFPASDPIAPAVPQGGKKAPA
jgi:hypothetical protein